jgi:hypothetical protein
MRLQRRPYSTPCEPQRNMAPSILLVCTRKHSDIEREGKGVEVLEGWDWGSGVWLCAGFVWCPRKRRGQIPSAKQPEPCRCTACKKT